MCALVLSVASLSNTTRGWEFSWVPVDSDGSFTLAGSDDTGEPTEIILDEGPAYIVEFELRLNGWSLAAGSPTLGTAQAGVDATGFLGVNAVPSNPGVDLTVLNNQAWRESVGGSGQNDGAYIATKTCHFFVPPSSFVNSGEHCVALPATMAFVACPVDANICFDNDDFVFNGNLANGAVSTATPNIVWGGVTQAEACTTDLQNVACTGPGTPGFCCTGEGTGNCPASYYLGTLVLNVPGGATGSYTFGFVPSIAQTFMNDCAGSALPDDGLAKSPGKVTLRADTGKCCYNTRIDPQCIDSVTEFQCNEEFAPRFFTLGATCSGAADECAIDCDGVAVSAGGQLAGDFTADGLVDLSDFQLWRPPFCRLSGPDTPMASPSTCNVFDFDCDGDLDVYDFAGFQHAFAP